MSLHTLKELNDRTADYIRMIIVSGYRIDPIEPDEDSNKFCVRLIKDNGDLLVIATEECSDCFIRSIRCSHADGICMSRPVVTKFFKSHDDVYADTKEEAEDELNRHYANKLGLDPNKNAIQQLADMLANHITDTFRKGGT